jgi:hypothetical protein
MGAALSLGSISVFGMADRFIDSDLFLFLLYLNLYPLVAIPMR